MSAVKQLFEELKPLLQAGQLQSARQKLLALGFPESIIPTQLDAARELIQQQRTGRRARRPQPVETDPLQ